jgi:hypothetical protein
MFLHTLYTSMCIFYTMSWSMIANIISMTTCVSHNTPTYYKQLLLMQARYVYTIANCWFHCGWIEILTLHSWKHYTHIHRTHQCIYYTQIYKLWLEDCLQRVLPHHFTHTLSLSLLTSTSTDANTTVIHVWCCILHNQICSLESLGENRIHHSLTHRNRISNMRFICPYCAHYDRTPTYHCAYFEKYYDEWLHECCKWHVLIHYRFHPFMTRYFWCKQ